MTILQDKQKALSAFWITTPACRVQATAWDAPKKVAFEKGEGSAPDVVLVRVPSRFSYAAPQVRRLSAVKP